MSEKKKPCIVCGKDVPKGKDRYCSRACYQASYQLDEKPQRVCAICGVALKDGRVKYCDAKSCRDVVAERYKEKSRVRSAKAWAKNKGLPVVENKTLPVNPYFLRRGDPTPLRGGSVIEAGVSG